jgi:hypothetical protein
MSVGISRETLGKWKKRTSVAPNVWTSGTTTRSVLRRFDDCPPTCLTTLNDDFPWRYGLLAALAS